MKFFSKKEWKLLWPFYLSSFVMAIFNLFIPFFVLFFSSKNFSSFQISILLAIISISTLLFEIPTGAIADLFGRKFSVLLGFFSQSIILILIFFANNYYLYLVLFALFGIAATFSSGSFQAWVIDYINKNKVVKVNSYISKDSSISNFGFIISGVLGAFFVTKFGLNIIWIITGGGLFLSTLLLFIPREDYKKSKIHIKESFKKITKQTKISINYSYKHPVLFYLLLILFITGIISNLDSLLAWVPLLKSFNFPDSNFGYLWSIAGVLGVFAPLISNKILKKDKERRLLIIVSVLFLIYGFLVLIARNLIFLITLILFSWFLLDFRSPVSQSYFHKFIYSKMRATIGSIASLIVSIAGILSMPLTGFLIDNIGPRYTIFLASLLMIPIIFLYLKIKDNKGV